MITFWRKNFLFCEYWLAILCAGIVSTVIGSTIKYSSIEATIKSIYPIFTVVFASLLCGSILATIVFGNLTVNGDKKLTLVKQSPHWDDLFDIFASLNYTTLLGFLISVIGLIQPKRIVFMFLLMTLSVVTARLLRVIWAIDNVVKIVTKQPKQTLDS